MNIYKLYSWLSVCIVFIAPWIVYAQSSMPELLISQSYNDRLYVQAGGGYIQSKDFKGGGGDIRLGYKMDHNYYGTHNLELEFDFLLQQAESSANYLNPFSIPVPQVGVVSAFTFLRKVSFDQYPLFLNYRFLGNFGKNEQRVFWYAGAGLGVNIIDYKNEITKSATIAGGGSFKTSSTTHTAKTQAACIVQGFLGIGYKITQALRVTLGSKLIGTRKYSFGGNTIAETTPSIATPQVQTDTLHWMIESSAHWDF